MLQSNYRLRRPVDVGRVRRKGQSWRHPLLILLVHANSLNVSRFAFIASRHCGKAVQRNRAKRLLRESVRTHLHHVQPGWDCVLIARPSLPQATYDEAETAVLQLLERAKLLTSPQNEGPQNEGPQNEGPQNEGPQNEGPQNEGPQGVDRD